MYRALYERSCALLLLQSPRNSYFGKVLLIIFASPWNNSLKLCIFVTLWSTLKQLLWESFIDKFGQYLEYCILAITQTLHIYQIFTGRRLCAGCSTKGAAHCSFRRVLLNRYFEKVLPTHFAITWKNLLEHIISVKFLLVKGDEQGGLREVLLIAFCCLQPLSICLFVCFMLCCFVCTIEAFKQNY